MEITHNSYNFFTNKTRESRIRVVLSWFLVLLSYGTFSQDSIVSKADVSEKNNLKFQDYFFKALTEKAIFNHKRAIENLEECNQLIPKNKAVLFELSKNYFRLNKLVEAIEYGNQALALAPENLWILEHLVKVHRKNYDFKSAITFQEKIVTKYPKKKQRLVYLYLQNGDIASAKKVLNELANAKMLNAQMRKIKVSLDRTQTKVIRKKVVAIANNGNLKTTFENDKTFVSLQKLLTYLDNKNDSDLLKYSEKGMALFPAQPIVYLMNGKALNKEKKHKEAIDSLKNGIDFVIDNVKLEANFYTQLIKAYEALGDTKNVRKYRKKLKS